MYGCVSGEVWEVVIGVGGEEVLSWLSGGGLGVMVGVRRYLVVV